MVSRYAVICPNHGQQFLTREHYQSELMQAGKRWECPICGIISIWDDENFENYMENESNE